MRERNIEQHDAETSRQGASIETRNKSDCDAEILDRVVTILAYVKLSIRITPHCLTII